MPSLETIQLQPNFPNEDLSDENSEIIDYYMYPKSREDAHANTLFQSPEAMRIVHLTAHNALRFCGIGLDYSEGEYHSFVSGFAGLERMSLWVNPRPYNGTLAVRKAKELLVQPGEAADLYMADKVARWQQVLPNTSGVIINQGDKAGDSMKEIQARTAGAFVACELQRIV